MKEWYHIQEIESLENQARDMLKKSVDKHKKYLQGYVNALYALKTGL